MDSGVTNIYPQAKDELKKNLLDKYTQKKYLLQLTIVCHYLLLVLVLLGFFSHS